MKFKTTFILLVLFAVLLGGVYFFESRSKNRKDSEGRLVNLESSDIQEITLARENETISFRKNENDDWMITQPLEARADNFEVNRLAGDFSELKIERVVEEEAKDPAVYEIPRITVRLITKSQGDPTVILLGAVNPLDKTVFAKRNDDPRVVLVPSSLGSILEKKVFDFRKKDIFNFETTAVERFRLKAENFHLEAEKREDEWFLTAPVASLAVTGKISGLLNALSNLRAREFISEDRTAEETRRYRLDRPDFEIELELPSSDQKFAFILNKNDETVYASTSLSTKIVSTEDSILTTLGKGIDEYRDKDIAKFYSWQVDGFTLKQDGLEYILAKDDENKWNFKSPVQSPADTDKIEEFLRKLDGLECDSFIDPPFSEGEDSLESAYGEITLRLDKGEEESPAINLIIGEPDEASGKVVIRNTRFDYMFRTPADFLDVFPRSPDDWKPEVEEVESRD